LGRIEWLYVDLNISSGYRQIGTIIIDTRHSTMEAVMTWVGNGTCHEAVTVALPPASVRLIDQQQKKRIEERAYFLWREECHRVGGIVHSNDLYHWFRAEEFEVALADKRPSPAGSSAAIRASHELQDAADGLAEGSSSDAGGSGMDYEYVPGVTNAAEEIVDCDDNDSDGYAEAGADTVLNLNRPEYAGMFLAVGPNGMGIVAVAPTYDALLERVRQRHGASLHVDIVTPT
jgi:hypothetical protein